MSAVAQVIYQQKEKPFDMEYYLNKHMPLVEKHWKSLGLTGYSVQKLVTPGYDTACLLYFKDADAMKACFESKDAKKVMDDIEEFSGYSAMDPPLILSGPRVGGN